MFAVVWHYWLGFFLSIGTVLTLLAVAAGYVAKVKAPQFQKKP